MRLNVAFSSSDLRLDGTSGRFDERDFFGRKQIMDTIEIRFVVGR